MDVVATLIEATVFDPVSATSQVVRVTNRNDPRATTFNGSSWLPVLSSAPDIGMSVFNGDFTGQGDVDLGSFTITLADGLADGLALMNWHGADIKIYAGDLVTGVFPQIYRCLGNGASRQGRLELSVELTTQIDRLDVNMLYLSYAGNGGLEGNDGVKGVLKPFCIGDAKFCQAVLIDDVRQIYQVHGYGPIEGTYQVFEGGQAIGQGPYQSYSSNQLAAFTNDAIPQGSWVRLNEYGLFRLGSAPSYPITCHAKGDTGGVIGGTALTKAGSIVSRMITMSTSLVVKASSIANMDAAQPQPFDDYYDSQTSVADACYKILLGFGGYLTFDENAQLILGRVRFGASLFTLSGTNNVEPVVLGINQLPASSPVWLFRLGAEQCHFVHQSSDIVGAIAKLKDDVAAASGKNKIFPASPTPPSGAIDGDMWPDNSIIPIIMRRYNGTSGTWVAVSSYVRQGTDIGVQNGATVGAPTGTIVGDRMAEQIVADLSLNGLNALYATASATSTSAILDSLRNLQDGSALTVKIKDLTTILENPDQSLVQTLNAIGSVQPNGNGGTVFVFNQNTALATPDKLLGETIDGLVNNVAGHESSITAIRSIVTMPDGSSELKAMTVLNADNVITGTVNTLTGGRSQYAVMADEFRIVQSGPGGKAFTPFSVIDGVVTMIDVVVRKLSYSALVPLFGGEFVKLDPNSGFQVMPGGLIMQWGRVRQTINSEVTFPVNFPMAFPNGVMSVGAMPYLASFSNVRDLWLQNVGVPTKTGAVFGTQAATNSDRQLDGFDWWAWGY